MVHVVEGIKCWDMCPVDALIKGTYGITSNKNREPLTYDDLDTDFTMHNGIIMSRSKPIYDLIMLRLESYLRTLKV